MYEPKKSSEGCSQGCSEGSLEKTHKCPHQEHARTDVTWTYHMQKMILTLNQEIIKGIYGD